MLYLLVFILRFLAFMQLTQHTDFALRTLMYAAMHTDRLVNITEIANYYAISRTHLAKVVATLTQTGYLQGVRGKNGGLKLAKEPQHINVGELVLALEPLDIVECLGSKNTCLIAPSCTLKNALAQAKQAFIDSLKAYTLADLSFKETTNIGAPIWLSSEPEPATLNKPNK